MPRRAHAKPQPQRRSLRQNQRVQADASSRQRRREVRPYARHVYAGMMDGYPSAADSVGPVMVQQARVRRATQLARLFGPGPRGSIIRQSILTTPHKFRLPGAACCWPTLGRSSRHRSQTRNRRILFKRPSPERI